MFRRIIFRATGNIIKSHQGLMTPIKYSFAKIGKKKQERMQKEEMKKNINIPSSFDFNVPDIEMKEVMKGNI